MWMQMLITSGDSNSTMGNLLMENLDQHIINIKMSLSFINDTVCTYYDNTAPKCVLFVCCLQQLKQNQIYVRNIKMSNIQPSQSR